MVNPCQTPLVLRYDMAVRHSRLFIFILLFLPFLAQAEKKSIWTEVQGRPFLTLKKFANIAGLKVFHPKLSERILLDGKKQALLLPGSPYFVVDGLFLVSSEAPQIIKGEVLLPADLVELLALRLVPKENREKLEISLNKVSEQIENGDCSLERPVKKIFVDPGHGGSDLGTKRGSLFEKDIVLKFSSILADELRRRGFEVMQSRTKDVFLPLDVRSRLATEWQADVFISLHVNSAPGFEATGTETYILSSDATDAAARKLALLENTLPEEAKSKASAVQDILWDMHQTAYLQDSARLGAYIQQEVSDSAAQLRKSGKFNWKWRNRGVRQAPFYVLSRAAMPAVLVELGYLTNKNDRRLLTEKFFQESLAKAVADGVKTFRATCKKRDYGKEKSDKK